MTLRSDIGWLLVFAIGWCVVVGLETHERLQQRGIL